MPTDVDQSLTQDAADDPCAERFPGAPENPWKHRRLRVPQTEGAVLARPSLDAAARDAFDNAQHLSAAGLELQGRTLNELRRQTREEAFAAAVRFTSLLRGESVAQPRSDQIIADGHQPQLFHTGVWAKNFAISGLADRMGAVPLHLVIDTDTFTASSINVPAGSRMKPRIESVPFDAPHATRPWEESVVQDAELFRAFPERVSQIMGGWNIDPCVRSIWPAAMEHFQSGCSLPVCLTAARHSLERRWGVANLEVPMSAICRLPSFLWFTAHLLANLSCFVKFYNEVLANYRRINRVRSSTHPVPELKSHDDWLEAPFWIWNDGDEQRGRLFARAEGDDIAIAREEEPIARLRLGPDIDASAAVAQLQELQQHGFHLRTRALTTTLFTRLCLCDLFIHGIGGAKYDEMTDRLFTRFYGIEPPRFMALSATHTLQLAGDATVEPGDIAHLKQQLRRLRFNPEQFLTESSDARTEQLIQEKKELIDEQDRVARGARLGATRREHHRHGVSRWRRLDEISDELSRQTADRRDALRKELESATRDLRNRALLNSREFSFCLFPEERLKSVMLSLRSSAAGEGRSA